VGGKAIPYIVSGSGGFAATRLQDNIVAPYTEGDVTLLHGSLVQFGYLTVSVDFSGPAKTLSVTFNVVDGQGHKQLEDSVAVNLPGIWNLLPLLTILE
jgi:hypothetical protein